MPSCNKTRLTGPRTLRVYSTVFMQALCIYAGAAARQLIAQNGLLPQHIGTIPAAAGGPKGLAMGALDQFIFGQWLPASTQSVDLVGASIGAWRMATACLDQPASAFNQLRHDYIHQNYEPPTGKIRPTAADISQAFGATIAGFYAGRVDQVVSHPRYRLHVMTSRGRHILHTEHRWRTPVGYLGAYLSNAVRRKALGYWLERVVFSSHNAALPFGVDDFPTRQIALNAQNFTQAVQASCSIPFVLQAVHNIPGAPTGAYWDGGITDYHLHLNYPTAAPAASSVAPNLGAASAYSASARGGLVLYPHFQKTVVPGWLDKHLPWRHGASSYLDTMVLLAPNPKWIKTLPNAKLPDRTDFAHYGKDFSGRVKAWTAACSASEQLADEFAAWLERPDIRQVHPL